MIKINIATTMKRSTGQVESTTSSHCTYYCTTLKRSRQRPIVSPPSSPSSPCSSSGTSFNSRRESWAFFDDIDNDYDNDNNSNRHSHQYQQQPHKKKLKAKAN
mmetsp:Transcript_18396/g.18620  ORF Transcript_18396/g.18620 Transcript_18396/m.18620 type:complete len:103 (-) Transcript_18396:46-354(-)